MITDADREAKPDSTSDQVMPSFLADSGRSICDLIIALAYMLDVQEEPCPYHSWRVAALAASMARHMDCDDTYASQIFYAALLHDVGAMGSFTHMVRYPTLNSQRAKAEVLAHPQRSANIIAGIPGLKQASSLAGDHHEWWNGCGYPGRKREDSIPLGAQLIRTADTIDLSKKLRPDSEAEDAAELAEVLCNIEIGPDAVEAFRAVIFKESLHRRLLDDSVLYLLIQELASELPIPPEWSERSSFDSLVLIFSKIVDAKHCFTSGHSQRVAGYAQDLARAMELSDEQVLMARYAGLVHDAGKVGVRRSIIDKVGHLDANEFGMIKRYPILSYDILHHLAHLSELATIARHHHEKWDGAGYPDGLKGEDIPLLSRILGVADAMDAITSPRSYKAAKSIREAIKIIRDGSGSQFDPMVVDAANSAWKLL